MAFDEKNALDTRNGQTRLLNQDEIARGTLNSNQNAVRTEPTTGGVAGTPAGDVTTIQGASGMTPVTTNTNGYSPSQSKTRPNDTTAYAAGDVVNESASAGTSWQFTSAGPSGGRILITAVWIEIDVSSAWSGLGTFRLHLYDSDPGAINDNAAFDLASGDRAKYLGFLDIPTPEDFGSTLWAQDDAVRKQAKLAAASTTLYGMVETRGATTPTAQAVIKVGFRAVRME